jgi:hypothetical protein
MFPITIALSNEREPFKQRLQEMVTFAAIVRRQRFIYRRPRKRIGLDNGVNTKRECRGAAS